MRKRDGRPHICIRPALRSPAKLNVDRLRLLSDDLTGALDATAPFAARLGPVSVGWDRARSVAATGHAALDLGSREGGLAEARAGAAEAAAFLAQGRPAFLKLDSLLRGHGLAEVAACVASGAFPCVVLAPAFPHQGRITRDGVQMRRDPQGHWIEVADIVALMAKAGLPARRAQAGSVPQPGVTVFDAETGQDLDAIVRCRAAAPVGVLWCGSAGLAAALARQAAGNRTADLPRLSGPVLGLFGSDQPTTAAQLAACGSRWIAVPDAGPASVAAIVERLDAGAALVSLGLPAEHDRGDARRRIAAAFAALVAALPRPGTLLAAGGETLRGLCDALGVRALDVLGEVEPGLPVSRLRGGRWDGVAVVSKSGAFGAPSLWRDLLASLDLQPTEAALP